jgi:hypothetical protein
MDGSGVSRESVLIEWVNRLTASVSAGLATLVLPVLV